MESSPIVEGQVTAQGRKAAVWPRASTTSLSRARSKGATASWLEHGGAAEDLLVARAPGAFEPPAVAGSWPRAAVGRGDRAGSRHRGDTPHPHVAGRARAGRISWPWKPRSLVIFGVLTVETVSRRCERAATTEGNKGGESMETALEMADTSAAVKRVRAASSRVHPATRTEMQVPGARRSIRRPFRHSWRGCLSPAPRDSAACRTEPALRRPRSARTPPREPEHDMRHTYPP